MRKLEYNVARSQTYIEELYPILHNFFSKLLRIEYNFTYNELIEEVETFDDEYGLISINQTKKQRLFDFLERLIDFEYNKIDREQKDIKEMFGECMEIVNEFTDVRKERDIVKNKSFFGFLEPKTKKQKEIELVEETPKPTDIEKLQTQAMEDIIEEKEGISPKQQITETSTELAEEEKLQEIEMNITQKFEKILKETQQALEQGDMPDGKRLYHNLRELYIELPEQEKKQYKAHLWDIYKKLK